jgi:hypothetical protein
MNIHTETATSEGTIHHRKSRTRPLVIWAAGLIFLGLARLPGVSSETAHSDFYDFTMKKFYIDKITFEDGSLRILPVSLDPAITKFGFMINGLASADGTVRLPETIEPKSYAFQAVVTPAGSGAGETVDFTFYPAKLYEEKGRMSEGNYIIVHKATVPTRKPSYVYRPPSYSADDLAFARRTWGGLKPPDSSSLALAQAIEEDIMLKLESHRGIPSDVMNVSSPRVQFERAAAGRDKVWCGNLAAIFQYVCLSLGVDVRIIHTGSEMQPVAPQVKFLTTEHHGTVEVYSKESGSWAWIDPTGRVLAATVDGAPLTLLQIVEALGTPLEGRIMVTTFDVKDKRRVTLPLDQSPAAGFMRNYFRAGVLLKF